VLTLAIDLARVRLRVGAEQNDELGSPDLQLDDFKALSRVCPLRLAIQPVEVGDKSTRSRKDFQRQATMISEPSLQSHQLIEFNRLSTNFARGPRNAGE